MNPYSFNFGYPYVANPLGNAMRIGGLSNIGRVANQKGLFTRLFGGIKNINWSNLLNNTSHTLGVINQAIPIVKQTGPMLNNMRSMLKVASVFKDTTDKPKNNNLDNKNIENNNKENTIINNSTSPNFFI